MALAICVFLCAFIHVSIRIPMCLAARFLHILPVRIHGKKDEGTQVFTFNHPSFLDKFVLFETFGQFRAVARDMSDSLPIFNFILNRIGCVLVKKGRRQNTTQRLLSALNQTKQPFVIATSSGIVSDDNIPSKLPTIAFRLQRRVQPIVIVYEGIMSDMLPDTLPKCLPYVMNPPRAVQPHVFFLPSLDPSTFASAEECAALVRKQMLYVISYTRTLEKISNE